MRTFGLTAFTVFLGCALVIGNGCGKSGKASPTRDAAAGGAVGLGGVPSGSGGAGTADAGQTSGGAGGTSATGGNATGGASFGGGGGAGSGGVVMDANGTGGIAVAGAGGAATGGNGADGRTIDANGVGGTDGGDAAGTATGGQGGLVDAPASGTGGVRLDGGGVGGSGGTLGSGGSPGSDCPATLPASGAACNLAHDCYYEDCAGSGRSVATCWSGAWRVSTGACGTTRCTTLSGGEPIVTCPAGQVCVQLQLTAVCSTPTCASGPVTQACVPGATGYCQIGGSLSGGISLWCCPFPGTGC